MLKRRFRRIYITIIVVAVFSYVLFFFLRLYTPFEEPYPMLILPGFGSQPEYVTRINNSQVFVMSNDLIVDSFKLKEIFGKIPRNSWSYVLKNNFFGHNPETKEWFREKLNVRPFDSAYYVTDSCVLRKNQIRCFRKDTVILLE